MADRVSKRAMMVALDIISGIVTLLATVFFALSGFNILAIAIMQVVLAVLDAMENSRRAIRTATNHRKRVLH